MTCPSSALPTSAANMPYRERQSQGETAAGRSSPRESEPPTWIWACLRFRFCRLPKQDRMSVGRALRDDRHLTHADSHDAVPERA